MNATGMMTMTEPKALMLARQGQPDAVSKPGGLSPSDPFGTSRQIAFRDEAGFAAGTLTLAPGEHAFEMTHAEALVVVDGVVALTSAGTSENFAAGSAFVLPRGTTGTLRVAGGATLVFNAMTSDVSGNAGAAPVRLDPTLARNPSAGPAEEVLIGPKPSCHSLNLFTDGSGMRAGVWDVTTPCARGYVPHRVHELMHIITGAVMLTHRDGSVTTVEAGDTVFLPRSAPYAWTSTRQVVKYYVVL